MNLHTFNDVLYQTTAEYIFYRESTHILGTLGMASVYKLRIDLNEDANGNFCPLLCLVTFDGCIIAYRALLLRQSEDWKDWLRRVAKPMAT